MMGENAKRWTVGDLVDALQGLDRTLMVEVETTTPDGHHAIWGSLLEVGVSTMHGGRRVVIDTICTPGGYCCLDHALCNAGSPDTDQVGRAAEAVDWFHAHPGIPRWCGWQTGTRGEVVIGG